MKDKERLSHSVYTRQENQYKIIPLFFRHDPSTPETVSDPSTPIWSYLAQCFVVLAILFWGGSAFGVSCNPINGDDGVDDSMRGNVMFPAIGFCVGSNADGALYDSPAGHYNTFSFVILIPDLLPRPGSSNPAKFFFQLSNGTGTVVAATASCPGGAIGGDLNGYTVTLVDGNSCVLTASATTAAGEVTEFIGTIGRSGAIYSSNSATVTIAASNPEIDVQGMVRRSPMAMPPRLPRTTRTSALSVLRQVPTPTSSPSIIPVPGH